MSDSLRIAPSRTVTRRSLDVSVHVGHLLLVAMIAMLVVVNALVRFYNRDERRFLRESWPEDP